MSTHRSNSNPLSFLCHQVLGLCLPRETTTSRETIILFTTSPHQVLLPQGIVSLGEILSQDFPDGSLHLDFFFLLTTAAFTEHKFRLSPAFTPPQSSLFHLSLEALLFSRKPISFQLQLNMQRALSSAARARPSFSNIGPGALASSPLSSRQQSRAYSHKVSALILI